MIFSCLIAIANYAIYMSTIDYMIASYGVYSASATGGNALARDFLAGIAQLYSTPMYTNIPGMPYEYASTILACIAILVTIPIYIFYYKGMSSICLRSLSSRSNTCWTAVGIDAFFFAHVSSSQAKISLGPAIRARSKFAEELASDRRANQGRRVSKVATNEMKDAHV